MIIAQHELKDFLKKQMLGLTGHIEVAKFPFDTVEWGQDDYTGKPVYCSWGHAWWAYEQTGYWVDGFTRCAILLRDRKAINRAKTIIYNVLNRADEDGYLGPSFLKKAEGEFNYDRWSHVVFFRAAMAMYEYNKDKTILDKLTRHYLGYRVNYAIARNVLNVEIMLWLYQKTGNKELLDYAEETYLQYQKWAKKNKKFNFYYYTDSFALSKKMPTKGQDNSAHGVGYNEYSKLGAILYACTGKKKYLESSISAYDKLEHYMLIDGLHNCAEKIVSNDVDRQHETCNVSDFTWSLNYLFDITGNTEYLDKIEKCVWNAGLGCVTEDFKSVQYFSCVNQIVLDNDSWVERWGKGAGYKPASFVECCIGNVNRFMPNYIWNSWKQDGDNVYLKLFGSSIYQKNGIQISERVNFPYENDVKLTVKTSKKFNLHLRVPKWSEGYTIMLDGKKVLPKEENGFIMLPIEKDCVIEYNINCSIIKHIDKKCIWFSKGAIVYTYKVPAIYKIDRHDERSSEKFPSYNIYPAGKWNYGIKEDEEFIEKDGKLFVKGYEVKNWKLYVDEQIKGSGQRTRLPAPPIEPIINKCNYDYIELTPYGLSECRITAFAKIKKDN